MSSSLVYINVMKRLKAQLCLYQAIFLPSWQYSASRGICSHGLRVVAHTSSAYYSMAFASITIKMFLQKVTDDIQVVKSIAHSSTLISPVFSEYFYYNQLLFLFFFWPTCSNNSLSEFPFSFSDQSFSNDLGVLLFVDRHLTEFWMWAQCALREFIVFVFICVWLSREQTSALSSHS